LIEQLLAQTASASFQDQLDPNTASCASSKHSSHVQAEVYAAANGAR
jgi:hypothetical protein